MQLGVVLLVCVCILCFTGAASGGCRALGTRPFAVFYIGVTALVLNSLPLSPIQELMVNPGALALLAFGVVVGQGRDIRGSLILALGMSLLGSFLMLLFTRLWPDAPEPGLLLGVLGAVSASVLLLRPGAAFICAAAAPLLLPVWVSGLELYAFGYTIAEVGMNAAFDAQVTGMLLIGIFTWLLSLRRQTERAG